MDTLIWLSLAAVAIYLIDSAIWPYTRCGRCDGTGKLGAPGGDAWRSCRRCGGKGTRVRAGRGIVQRLWTRN